MRLLLLESHNKHTLSSWASIFFCRRPSTTTTTTIYYCKCSIAQQNQPSTTDHSATDIMSSSIFSRHFQVANCTTPWSYVRFTFYCSIWAIVAGRCRPRSEARCSPLTLIFPCRWWQVVLWYCVSWKFVHSRHIIINDRWRSTFVGRVFVFRCSVVITVFRFDYLLVAM